MLGAPVVALLMCLMLFFPTTVFADDDNEGRSTDILDIPHHTPPNAQANVKPKSMIVMSNDHQLFFEAYTDYEEGYQREVEYYGYFDSEGCYKYSNERFEYFRESDSLHGCDGNRWSGNFLNWASMTRMDVLRKVLYGGKRYRDDAESSTILERAFIPYDAHSFVKVVRGNDIIKSSTPFNEETLSVCNTTGYSGSEQSQEVLSSPPQIRIVDGEWPNWAANERWQCVWRGEDNRSWASILPTLPNGSRGGNYTVRVEVCAGKDALDCASYPDSKEDKPIGLLHEYADTIDFGLLSGSYAKNKNGGVLRSNIKQFSEEYNISTGVFKQNSDVFDRIVGNINAFRIARYNYSDGVYNNSDSCPWGRTSFSQGNCSNWGNPFSEMTLEALRYLGGADAASAGFTVGIGNVENNYIKGLTSPAWENEVDEEWCAAHSMILINSSDSSFDNDSLDGWGQASKTTIQSETDQAGEDLSGKYFFGGDDKLCTAKDLEGLSQALGICPGSPRLDGSYNVAGLAKYAYENNVVINPEKPSEGENISSYALRLSTNVPVINVKNNERDTVATLVPACQNTGSSLGGSDGGRCAIVDFRKDPDVENKYQIVWEDSEFGGDYDSDLRMELSFDYGDHYNAGVKTIRVTTKVISDSTSQASGQMGVGYVISGAERIPASRNDTGPITGFIAHSGIYGYSSSLCRQRNGGCNRNDGATSQYYSIGGTASASALPPPLSFAGASGNEPDAYFDVNDISELPSALSRLLEQVAGDANRTGAGLGYSKDVGGTVYQTTYNNTNGWSGDLQAVGKEVWKASDELPSPGERNIITYWNGYGIPFDDYGIGSFKNTVAHIKGSPLGDFIDSKPFVVKGANSYYVRGSVEGDSYLAFVAQQKDRKPMVYVGANDGMMHGFDALNGDEEIAYIPGLLLNSISELADPDYEHRFYVDGSPAVGDALWGGNWHSVLASGLGAGGRGLFALDVTDPGRFGEAAENPAIANQIALFEYGETTERQLFQDDGDSVLGYIYGPPSITLLENERHAVIFGNGFSSPAGKAALYIIYLDGASDGRLSKEDVIRLIPRGGYNNNSNGLSTVTLIDRDRNGRMDTAYAGDLQGSLWRFDLSDKNDDEWPRPKAPLFSTKQGGTSGGWQDDDEDDEDGRDEESGYRDPVVTKGVAVGRDPKRGFLVFFGTGAAPGRLIPTSEDRGATDGFYAVCDVLSDLPGTSSAACYDPNVKLPLTRNSDGIKERVLKASNTFDTIGSGPEKGWYMDFKAGERLIDTPELKGEQITFASRLPGYGMCGAEDEGYLYKLNAFRGASFSYPVLDVDGDGEITGDDIVENGDDTEVPVAVKTDGSVYTPTEDGRTVNSNGELQDIPILPEPIGRVSWRELEN